MATYGIVDTPKSEEGSKYAMAPTTLGRPQPEIQNNPLMSASLGTIAGGSFIDDRDVLLRHYAKARFPDDPDAVDRYGISDEGIIYYVADDGNAYAEIPDDYSVSSLLKRGAQDIGRTIPFATGTAAGILSAPMLMAGPAGAAGSMALTGAAAAGGEGIRQAIGNAFFDDPVDTGDVASEAAWAAGGQGAAGVMGRFANRNMARDLSRMNVPESNRLGQNANAFGVRLSPAEQTNLRTLGAKEKILRELPDSANIMDDFKMAQQGDVYRTTNAFMDSVSPIDDALPAGQMAKEAAGNAMKSITAQRAAQAKPFYVRAFKNTGPVDITPTIDHIDARIAALKGKGKIAAQLKRVRNLLTDEDFAEDSLELLHNRKIEIDDMIKPSASNSLGANARRELTRVLSNEDGTGLVDIMKASSPDYAKGAAVYRDMVPGVEAVNEGIVGAIANLNDKTLEKAASMMFSNRGPQSIRNARNLISKQDPEAWNALLRSFLQKEFVQAGKEFSTTRGITNQGSKFAMRVMGTEAQRDVMKAAMSDSQWRVFKPLIEVLQATGRTAASNSDTAFKQVALGEMQREGGGLITKAQRIAGGPMSALREYAEGVALGRYAEDLATRITQPGAVNQLKELTKLPPNSLRARVIVGQFLGLTGKGVDLAPSVGVEPTLSNPLQAPSQGQ